MKYLLMVLVALVVPVYAEAQINADGDGTAIHGYDPVAYFTEGRPTRGSERYSYTWQGAEWRFASEENRRLFEADPERYAPQYGGFCAFAVSRGGTADIDPEAWSIVDGRLFLNLSPFVQRRFELRLNHNIEEADERWPEVRRQVR